MVVNARVFDQIEFWFLLCDRLGYLQPMQTFNIQKFWISLRLDFTHRTRSGDRALNSDQIEVFEA
jgi:hypothetical protein